MVISKLKDSTVSLTKCSLANQFDVNPSIEVISQKAVEQYVKENLENIIWLYC